MTSRAENTFLGEKFNVNGGPPAGWLGGWDNTEGTWEWMNGPEKGRRFLSANTTCGGTNKYHVIRGRVMEPAQLLQSLDKPTTKQLP